jgi:phage shock protein A
LKKIVSFPDSVAGWSLKFTPKTGQRDFMKQFIYWLMGEKAGRVTLSAWNWLWGKPVEPETKALQPVAAAEQYLQSMQESVQKLAAAVNAQETSYKSAKTRYKAKVKELQNLEQQAVMAQNSGDEAAARMAIAKVIQTEQLLAQLEEMVKQAEAAVNASQMTLHREQMKVEKYKLDMQNMKDLADMNEALEAIAKINNEFNIGSAQAQFEATKSEMERRNLEQQALAELENPDAKLLSDIDNHEVERRLKQISNKTNNSNYP